MRSVPRARIQSLTSGSTYAAERRRGSAEKSRRGWPRVWEPRSTRGAQFRAGSGAASSVATPIPLVPGRTSSERRRDAQREPDGCPSLRGGVFRGVPERAVSRSRRAYELRPRAPRRHLDQEPWACGVHLTELRSAGATRTSLPPSLVKCPSTSSAATVALKRSVSLPEAFAVAAASSSVQRIPLSPGAARKTRGCRRGRFRCRARAPSIPASSRDPPRCRRPTPGLRARRRRRACASRRRRATASRPSIR